MKKERLGGGEVLGSDICKTIDIPDVNETLVPKLVVWRNDILSKVMISCKRKLFHVKGNEFL